MARASSRLIEYPHHTLEGYATSVNSHWEEPKVTRTYSVPGMHCRHCEKAVRSELEAVSGVEGVDVDLGTKLVTITGEALDDATLVAAIDEAGYDAELVA